MYTWIIHSIRHTALTCDWEWPLGSEKWDAYVQQGGPRQCEKSRLTVTALASHSLVALWMLTCVYRAEQKRLWRSVDDDLGQLQLDDLTVTTAAGDHVRPQGETEHWI